MDISSCCSSIGTKCSSKQGLPATNIYDDVRPSGHENGEFMTTTIYGCLKAMPEQLIAAYPRYSSPSFPRTFDWNYQPQENRIFPESPPSFCPFVNSSYISESKMREQYISVF